MIDDLHNNTTDPRVVTLSSYMTDLRLASRGF
eukprot:SAG25_NODE_4029_length_905_cov_0.983871_1_plen_31_part_10